MKELKEEIKIFVVGNYPWLKSFLQMTGGILKASSYERITSLINSNELNNLLFNFFKSIKKKINNKIKEL